MEGKTSVFGVTINHLQAAIFVAGVAVGASTVWAILKATQNSVPFVPETAGTGAPPTSKHEKVEDEEFEEDEEDYDSDEELTEEEFKSPNNKPHKMLLVIRTDLKMKPGKIAAQVGHATLGAYKTARQSHPLALKYWSYHGQAKVAVKVKTEAEMDEIRQKAIAAGINTHVVHDAGKTQVAAGSRTVLALGPAPIDEIDKIASHLKLY
jgi:PTH2 family peptidyl-tRNA hydrolase